MHERTSRCRFERGATSRVLFAAQRAENKLSAAVEVIEEILESSRRRVGCTDCSASGTPIRVQPVERCFFKERSEREKILIRSKILGFEVNFFPLPLPLLLRFLLLLLPSSSSTLAIPVIEVSRNILRSIISLIDNFVRSRKAT